MEDGLFSQAAKSDAEFRRKLMVERCEQAELLECDICSVPIGWQYINDECGAYVFCNSCREKHASSGT